jgi:hypothetical protein
MSVLIPYISFYSDTCMSMEQSNKTIKILVLYLFICNVMFDVVGRYLDK